MARDSTWEGARVSRALNRFKPVELAGDGGMAATWKVCAALETGALSAAVKITSFPAPTRPGAAR
jgi:hypothetical protein